MYIKVALRVLMVMLIFIKGALVRLDPVSLKDAKIINIIFVNLNSMLMHDFISRNGQKRFLKKS